MKKKFLSLILGILIIFSALIPGCKPSPRDISGDTPLAASVVYANNLANQVQGYYNNESRSSYTLENTDTILINDLSESKMSTLTNKDGDIYFADTLDYFIKDKDGEIYYNSKSNYSGRINTLRLGYYYYESHVYDMTFGSKGAYIPTKTADIGKFDEGNFFVLQNNVITRVENKKLVMDYEEGSLGIITVEKKNISLDLNKFPQINLIMTGSPESVLFTPYINGFATDDTIEVTPGYSFNLKDRGYEGKTLTGYKISFVPEGTYTTLSVKGTERKAQPRAISLDKTAHFYSDKYHQEMHIVTQEAMCNLDSMGMEIKLEKSTVKKTINEEGFVGFDIKKAGILGFILPSDNSVDNINVSETEDIYIITISKNLPDSVPTEYHQRFGIRIYTDYTHSFDDLINEANIERNPVSKIEIEGENQDNAEFLGYDYIRGMYRFDMDGSHFNEAYYEKPNKYFNGYVSFINDNLPRNAYIWFNTDNACLESAALLDKNNILQPIPMQVGKNFSGESEEAFYLSGDKAYGDTIFPITAKENETLSFKLLNLYQNWGLTPLKQISWIQFVCSYYHLSTGVTESNCIAPYYFNGTINTLPDFRARSGIMWAHQPQFNSVGVPSFVTSKTYTGSKINSYGPTYADVEYSYIDAEEGLYKYTLRHVEFPQTDENRTYYTITIEFLKNGKISELPLTIFDSSDTFYDNFSYLDKNNKEVEFNTSALIGKPAVEETLGNKGGFVSLYNINFPTEGSRGANVSYIVKNISGKLNGKNYTNGVKCKVSLNNNEGSYTFKLLPDVNEVKFRKGDKLTLDIILLPWGSFESEGNETTTKVRTDSVLNSCNVVPVIGEKIDDTWIPTVKCIENTAEIALSGGCNNNVVKLTNISVLGKPDIKIKTEDGSYKEYIVGNEDYDGYTVFYNKDTGNYEYSFIWREPGTYKISFK